MGFGMASMARPEHGAEAVVVTHALECTGWQKWRPFPPSYCWVLSCGWLAPCSDDVEMGEADASDGAVKRGGIEGLYIVAAGGLLLVGHDNDSDGGRGS